MEKIALARAAHLLVFVELLREIGAPVDRELAHSKLPSSVEEYPDDFISLRFALDFVAGCAVAVPVPVAEIALMAARRASLAMLHRDFQLALLHASGLAKLNALIYHAERENTVLVAGIARSSSAIRVICDLEPFRDHPALACAEWLIHRVLLAIGRSIAGPGWCPSEMTFMARDALCDAAVEAFGGCRMLTGQSHTSVLFPVEQLAASAEERGAGDADVLLRGAPVVGDGFVATLRMAVRPYLADGYPDVGLAAEIAGLSRRTLQRELARRGRTYSEVVREARFDAACRLLGNPAVKIIDVAFETGYANPQHFSRAFRQLAGMSPRAYRKRCAAEGGLGLA